MRPSAIASATPAAWMMRAVSWSKCTARGSGWGAGCFSSGDAPAARSASRDRGASVRRSPADDDDVRLVVTAAQTKYVERALPWKCRRADDELRAALALKREQILRFEDHADRVQAAKSLLRDPSCPPRSGSCPELDAVSVRSCSIEVVMPWLMHQYGTMPSPLRRS